MPKGFTDSVQKARNIFEELKKESLIKGKNLATINNVSKQSGTSRNNFYTKKSQDWVDIVKDIDDFSKDFIKLAQGKYKNPEVETHKKSAKDCEKKYISMSQQNTDLLQKINNLNRIIEDKQETIDLLNKQLNNYGYYTQEQE